MAIRKTETSERNRRTLSDNFDSFQSLIDTNRKMSELHMKPVTYNLNNYENPIEYV